MLTDSVDQVVYMATDHPNFYNLNFYMRFYGRWLGGA
jgi:hypothetical protein